jgi:hypothetical protein
MPKLGEIYDDEGRLIGTAYDHGELQLVVRWVAIELFALLCIAIITWRLHRAWVRWTGARGV